MEKYSVLKTTVTNRSSVNNSILEEDSELLQSFPSLDEAKAFAANLDLQFCGATTDVYKEIIREE